MKMASQLNRNFYNEITEKKNLLVLHPQVAELCLCYDRKEDDLSICKQSF